MSAFGCNKIFNKLHLCFLQFFYYVGEYLTKYHFKSVNYFSPMQKKPSDNIRLQQVRPEPLRYAHLSAAVHPCPAERLLLTLEGAAVDGFPADLGSHVQRTHAVLLRGHRRDGAPV